MAVTAASLRANFTEFINTDVYPDADVNFWLATAALLINAGRWGNMLDMGTQLFVAHNLVLEAKAKATAANGAPPGVSDGPIAAKSIDKVSVNYASAEALEENAGHWNLTIFGTRFIKLARMCGMGPIQVGAGAGCYGPLSSINAWPGCLWGAIPTPSG